MPIFPIWACKHGQGDVVVYLEKAKALVESMPFELDAMVLKTLLGTCKICGDIEFASHVAKSLLEPEPKEHYNYVLLSNMYEHLKMWD